MAEPGALDAVFTDFYPQLEDRDYLVMGGQSVDATLLAAPKQRSTALENDAIKVSTTAREILPDDPAKAAHKDMDARWALKFAKARSFPDGRPT